MRASFVLAGVATGIRRNLSMTVALVLSTAIALGFVGSAILANREIGRFKQAYEDKINVSIYLCPQDFGPPCKGRTTDQQWKAIEAKLKADPSVASYKYESEKDVYNRRKPYIDPAIIRTGVFKEGVLPATVIVHLRDLRNDFLPFHARYVGLPGVSDVTNQREEFETLLNMIDSFLTLSLTIAVIVLVASLLLIANTVQVAAAQRQEETSIMRLVGASRWMTELPFILETVLATLIGGLAALGAIAIGKVYVLDNIFRTQTRRGVIPNLDRGDIVWAGAVGLGVGVVLAAITAFATLRFRVKL